MILEIILLVVGLPLVLFLPGYLLAILLFEDVETFPRVLLGIALSLAISVFVGFLLTLVGFLFEVKGLTQVSVIISLLFVTLVFAEILWLRHKRRQRG